MGRPRLDRIRYVLTAIIAAAGVLTLTMTASAAAMPPWQKAWGDYDNHNQWHDASWWLKNRHHWVTVHHREWTDNYADINGRICDSDRFHAWHYGDGSFDRNSAVDEIANESLKSA
jgi:hypothetical protein